MTAADRAAPSAAPAGTHREHADSQPRRGRPDDPLHRTLASRWVARRTISWPQDRQPVAVDRRGPAAVIELSKPKAPPPVSIVDGLSPAARRRIERRVNN